MRLIGRYASPYARRVGVTLMQYGIPYVHVPVMPFGGDRADVKARNPIVRVPVLELDNGEHLIDSAAILDYLDQKVGPERALTPATGPERRRVLSILAVATGITEMLVAALYERHFRPREMWYRPWLETREGQVRDGYGWLEEQLVGDWFVGGRMTQADVSIAVFWSFGVRVRPGFFGRMACPRVAALTARLEETPAFQEAIPEDEPLAKVLESQSSGGG